MRRPSKAAYWLDLYLSILFITTTSLSVNNELAVALLLPTSRCKNHGQCRASAPVVATTTTFASNDHNGGGRPEADDKLSSRRTVLDSFAVAATATAVLGILPTSSSSSAVAAPPVSPPPKVCCDQAVDIRISHCFCFFLLLYYGSQLTYFTFPLFVCASCVLCYSRFPKSELQNFVLFQDIVILWLAGIFV